MRSVLASLTIVALSDPCALARNEPPARAPQRCKSFDPLKQEFEDAVKTWQEECAEVRERAKKNGEKAVYKPSPSVHYSPRFLAIVEREPEGPEAASALRMVFQTSNASKRAPILEETRAKAIKILRDHYADKPSISGFLKIVTQYSDDDSKALLAKIAANNPDRKIQCAVQKERIAYLESVIMFSKSFAIPEQRKLFDKEFIDNVTAKSGKAKTELEGLKKILRDNYNDLYNELSVGYPAPELEMQTPDGKPTTLSALKGKVVVLDIWATWCGPCKAMIPHEREMVARLKDKPFQLVGISIDSELKPLQEFLAKEKLPWTHWWAGPGGWESAIAQDWDIRSVPAIFVLDPQGVIRYKDLRGAELEKAVNVLLNQMEPR